MIRGVREKYEFTGGASGGFTLIEILVVVFVVALLAVFSMPAIGRARESARATKCINNLHQIGIAFGAYATDHEGKYPPILEVDTGDDPNESVWSNLLITEGYLPDPSEQVSLNVFLCPFDPAAPFRGAEGVRSYAYNALPPDTIPPEVIPDSERLTKPLNPLQVERLATTIMLAEWYDKDPEANPDSSGWDSAGWAYRSGGGIYPHHPGGTSGVLFYDLHAEAVKAIPHVPSPDSPLRWSFTSP